MQELKKAKSCFSQVTFVNFSKLDLSTDLTLVRLFNVGQVPGFLEPFEKIIDTLLELALVLLQGLISAFLKKRVMARYNAADMQRLRFRVDDSKRCS